jgi:hypothetical protein
VALRLWPHCPYLGHDWVQSRAERRSRLSHTCRHLLAEILLHLYHHPILLHPTSHSDSLVREYSSQSGAAPFTRRRFWSGTYIYTIRIIMQSLKEEYLLLTSCWGTSWPKSRSKSKWFSVLDTPQHVDSEKLNRQISYRSYLDWFFSKRDLNS